MRNTKLGALGLLSIINLIACRPAPEDDVGAGGIWKPSSLTQGGTWSGVTFTSLEATAALDMANVASLSQLDSEIGLDSRAAQNIVADRPVTTMEDLDAVPYVGASALQALRAYAVTWVGQPGSGATVSQSGVTFTASEVTILLDLVNKASLTTLDQQVGLDSRAAQNIVADRPIKSLAALDAVAYVGATALKQLKSYLPLWGKPAPPPPVSGGTYDGVTFTAQQETTALAIANTAHPGQLKAGGVAPAPRGIIVQQRPWASLAALAACSGIGPATMQALAKMVSSWTGPLAPPTAIGVAALALEAATKGTASAHHSTVVSVKRAIITTTPEKRSSGSLSFWVADPTAGALQQLKVQISAGAGLSTSFASIHDDVSIQGRFEQEGSIFQLGLTDASLHAIALNASGLDFKGYLTIQAAWSSTAANPEGAVRVSSDLGQVYVVPLPILLDHPMWGGSPPGPPKDSGNVQDLAWNAAAQQKLNAWRKASGL